MIFVARQHLAHRGGGETGAAVTVELLLQLLAPGRKVPGIRRAAGVEVERIAADEILLALSVDIAESGDVSAAADAARRALPLRASGITATTLFEM